MPPQAVLPAQQARSRESLRKLLDATREVLGQYGMDGATIPRIARRAGLTPGSVYRRFQDKAALLETAILEILERQEETMKTRLAPLATAQVPFPEFAGKMIGGMVSAYRAHAGLLRGIRQFVQGRLHTPFGKKVAALEVSHFQRTVGLFLTYRKQIRHPHPRRAISLALMMVVGTLYQLVVWPTELQEMRDLLPNDDEALARELTRALVMYLGVEE